MKYRLLVEIVDVHPRETQISREGLERDARVLLRAHELVLRFPRSFLRGEHVVRNQDEERADGERDHHLEQRKTAISVRPIIHDPSLRIKA
jgi:hypothetical protein